MLLSEEQLREAARQMAHGISRRSLIDGLHAELVGGPSYPEGKSQQQVRDLISNELASAQKGNPRFAEKKYGQLWDTELELIRESYVDMHYETRNQIVERLKEQVDNLTKDGHAIQDALDNYEPQATNPPDYLQLYNLKLKMNAQLLESAALLHRITGRLTDITELDTAGQPIPIEEVTK